MSRFEPFPNLEPTPGMVLGIACKQNIKFLRLTHSFDSYAYVMWVDEHPKLRLARRPKRIARRDLEYLATGPAACWGRLHLPDALTDVPAENSPASLALKHAWGLIKPLIDKFDCEQNLNCHSFEKLIRERASMTGTEFITVKRLVLRYYYFGNTPLALLQLPRGPKPYGHPYQAMDGGIADATSSMPRRRGRQPACAKAYGPNDFLVSNADVADIRATYQRYCAKGSRTVADAYVKYLSGPFRARHPQISQEYLDKKRVEPVTLRQFRYYNERSRLIKNETTTNQPYHRYLGHQGLHVVSPGELTEIDATGGRIFLVKRSDKTTKIATPTIYIAVDRWSRFILGIYVSLKPPSYEELRYLLLVSMTSRSRFRALDVDIDDARWPYGRLSVIICIDRGSELKSESTKQAVADDLRVELTVLPPLCPDGKAIVERLIGVLKGRMASSGLKGTFKDRPTDPVTRRAARKARTAAVHSLADVYRALIELVIEHNTRPHRTLRRYKILTSAGIPPTPQEAYLWGIKNIGGLHAPPLTDSDYERLLLATRPASIKGGVVTFRRRSYHAINEEALILAAKSTRRSKKIIVRVDETFPYFLYVPDSQHAWAKFGITESAVNEFRGLTLDEEDALEEASGDLWAEADTQALRKRVESDIAKAKRTSNKEEISHSTTSDRLIRERETAKVKHLISSPKSRSRVLSSTVKKADDWKETVTLERREALAAIRKQRRRI
jgi:putative transposase